MRFDGIIFDFDGVLIESEHEINRLIARLLTDLGHPTTARETTEHFTGLSGQQFIDAVEARIGRSLPTDFHQTMRAAGARAMTRRDRGSGRRDRLRPLLTPTLPKAVASSSSTRWVRAHLDHLGLADVFGPHIYSGKEHVERGKPHPDLYLHAAQALGIDIRETLIIEDSKVGATGALASGATVIGLAAGKHCFDDHADMLRAVGVREVAHDFDELARLIGLDQPSK